MSGTIFELIPQERNLLAELGGRLRALMPTLLSQWELGLDDILRKEQEFVSKGLREESLAAAHGLLQGMSEGRVEDAWQEGEAYGKSMARQGLDYRVLGNWLSLLCQTLLAGLAQVCGDDDRLEQTIVVLGRFLSTYTFRVTASFSKRQQRSSQEQQEALQRDYEASQRRITELVVLNEIGQAFSSTIDLADLLEVIYRQIGRLMDTNCFFIALCDWEQGLLHFVIDQEEGVRQAPHSMDIQEGLSGYVARTGQPLFLPHGPEVFLKEQGMPHIGQPCKCWLGVPMVIQERTVGVIAVQNYQEEQVYDQDHQRVLSTVAAQAAAAVENAHLYREAHRRVEQFSALQKISLKLASTTDLSEVLDLIADSAMGLLQSSDIIIFLYEASRQSFTLGTGLRQTGERGLFTPMPRPDGLTARVARQRKMVVIENVPEHPLYADHPDQAGGLRSLASIPLLRSGEVLGVLNVAYYHPHRFTEDELRLLQAFADQATVAVFNAHLFQKTRNMMAELQETAEAQSQLLHIVRELSTPVVPLMEGVLLMPLVSSVDSTRGRHILDRLLGEVELRQAQVVLVDITGVPIVDTAVAQILLNAVHAVRILGGEMVLVGITPEVAQTLVSLGVDLSGIVSRSDLQGGLAYAIAKKGRGRKRPGKTVLPR